MFEFTRNDALSYELNEYYEKNTFVNRRPENKELPTFAGVKDVLPTPIFDGHDDYISCYYKAWEIAFSHLRQPVKDSGFVSNFIDSAFNDCLFMWDSSFITLFARYANQVFPFQKTLDNFYAMQHKDGFICRTIYEKNGKDRFGRFDPSATGPNILALSEWLYFENMGDVERLRDVYAPLRAFHIWLRKNHTWRDGSYYSSGWGCGMDNVPRLQPGYDVQFSNGKMIWVDTCLQQLLNAKILLKINQVLRLHDDVRDLEEEVVRLTPLINGRLWDDQSQFYYDLWENDEWNMVKHLGAYWALLAEVVPEDKVAGFVAHLENEKEFNRPNPIPTLSADHPEYSPVGSYWKGGVWAPTNYMVLRGLTKNGYDGLAYKIADKYLKNIVEVYDKTGTLYENYAPEKAEQGTPAKANFVGWTGLAPIAIFFEYVLGIQSDAARNRIVWNVNRIERHGVENYPFGVNTKIDLLCSSRVNEEEEPIVVAKSDVDVEIVVRWKDKEKIVRTQKKIK